MSFLILGAFGLLGLLFVITLIGSLLAYNLRGETNWTPLFAVVFGLPLVLAVTGIGAYFSMAQVLQLRVQTTNAARLDAEAARAAAEHARLRSMVAAEENRLIAESGLDAPPTPIAPMVTVSEQSHTSTSHARLNWGIVILAVVIAGLLLLARKSPKLAMATGGCLALGGMFVGYSKTEVRNPVVIQQTEQESLLISDFDLNNTTLGPVDEDGKQITTPIQVRHEEIDGDQIRGVVDTTIPEWVKLADGKNIRRGDDIIVTSKQFSTPDEAEVYLTTLATEMVKDQLIKSYPDIDPQLYDPRILPSFDLIREKCVITWPFKVGEIDDQMYQVAWRITLNDEKKELVRAHWQQEEVKERLAYLGGGLAGLTTLFGASAVFMRRREQKPTVQQA